MILFSIFGNILFEYSFDNNRVGGRGLGDQLLSQEFSEIDPFLHLACRRPASAELPVSYQNTGPPIIVLPKPSKITPQETQLYLLVIS